MAKIKIIFAVVLFSLFPLVSQAAEPAHNAAGCDLSVEAKALAEAKAAPVSDFLEGVRLELRARKALLVAAIDCIMAETDELKREAENLPEIRDIARIKQEIVLNIRDAREYLERQKGQIPNLGIQGTKDVAREIKSWRNGSYARLKNEVSNLKVWSGNQTLFETAKKRLEEITRTVRLLKLLENDEVWSIYEKSEISLKKADNIHRRALQNIKECRSQEEIAGSLKASLETLFQTYQNFLDLSQAAKKILPL